VTVPEADQFFRASAGAAVINDDLEVLTLERADLPGRWQLPQGGIRSGETPIAAAYRELREETGLAGDQLELLAEVPGWVSYELPPDLRSSKVGRGQTQKWFIFRLKDGKADIRFDTPGVRPEFTAWKWVPINELLAETANFRLDAYRRVAEVVRNLRAEGSGPGSDRTG
jgi:8-oxo-dGTP pyrophosphatase MutT (NUDIX family)